jgi:exopolyphosphatase/guanosine-5'-triphosphate,3'-diphosphate pyrophosphatase
MISGEKEAEILDMVVHKDLGDGHFMHIDVGGGSTEINLIHDKKSYAHKSFKLGSVRNMQGREASSTWELMTNWIKENRIEPFEATIATGGNIRTLQRLLFAKNEELTTLDQLSTIVEKVNSLTIEERIEKLGLREDRADVIPFASEIYLAAMAQSGSDKILIPNVGLKDGIIEMLYARNSCIK